MLVKSDLLHPLRKWSLVVPIAVALAIAILWIFKRPLKPRLYLVAIALLAVGIVLSNLPKIDSGYEQTYWIGDQKHSIPWRYGPYNGDEAPGGTHFRVRVSPHKLMPRYDVDGQTIIVGKWAEEPTAYDKLANSEICASDGLEFQCLWRQGAFFYTALGRSEFMPDDPLVFSNRITEMMDGFEG